MQNLPCKDVNKTKKDTVLLKNVVFPAIDSIEFGDRRGKYSDTSECFKFVRPGGCGKLESGYK